VHKLYSRGLEQNPTALTLMFRRIAVTRHLKFYDLAIKELNSYLQIFTNDLDAWKELASIYIEIGKFEEAKFCVEELLLRAPFEASFMLFYAELAYTIAMNQSSEKNKLEGIKLAKQYYIMCVDASPVESPPPRALYGLRLCARKLCSAPGAAKAPSRSLVPTKRRDTDAELALWCTSQLVEQCQGNKFAVLVKKINI